MGSRGAEALGYPPDKGRLRGLPRACLHRLEGSLTFGPSGLGATV